MKASSTALRNAFIALVIVAMLCSIPLALAQNTTGVNSISGRVYDANHKAIPNAKVTIYYTKFVMDYVAEDPVKIQNNPQFSGDGSTSLTGLYQFSGLNPDVYIVTAEKNGVAFSQTVQVRQGTTTADITIPGYVEKSYSTSPTPTPKPSPTFTNIIPPVTMPQTDFGAILFDALRLLLLGLVGIQLIAGVAIIVIGVGKPKQ